MDRSELTGVAFWFWRFGGEYSPLTKSEAEMVVIAADILRGSARGHFMGDRETLDQVLQTCGLYERFYSAH